MEILHPYPRWEKINLAAMSFNGQLRGSLTAAALARQIPRDQPLLCIDEAEDLAHGQHHREIFRLLRAMYRRSGNREVCGPRGTSAVSNLFCPVIIVNILGTDDALRDRIIEIQTVPRVREVERFLFREQHNTLQRLRDDLYRFACACVGQIYDTYRTFPPVAHISDRTEELWLPIFTLAKSIDEATDALGLFDEMVGLAKELGQQRTEQESFAARDTRIIAGLYFCLASKGLLGCPSVDVNAAEITTFIQDMESMNDLRIEEVSRVLRRAKIIMRRFRRRIPGNAPSNPLMHYSIDVNGVVESAKTLGVLQAS